MFEDVVPTEPRPTKIGDHDHNRIPDLMVKFDRSAVQGLVSVGYVELTVTGEVDGILFSGSDTIRVIRPGKPEDWVPPGQAKK